jgi:hypothetical protein
VVDVELSGDVTRAGQCVITAPAAANGDDERFGSRCRRTSSSGDRAPAVGARRAAGHVVTAPTPDLPEHQPRSTMDQIALQDTVDHVAITRLQSAYADIVNRRAWAELTEIFRPDATVSIDRRAGDPLVLDGPAAVGEFIGGAIAHMDFFEFVILNVTVNLRRGGEADRAAARMYMCELRHERDLGRRTTAFGVYHDEYVRVDGTWFIAGRTYHSIARTDIEHDDRDLDVFGFPEAMTRFVSLR